MNNYLPKVLARVPDLKLGTVNVVHVRHDDWCAFLNGQGECDCDPDIEIEADAMSGRQGKRTACPATAPRPALGVRQGVRPCLSTSRVGSKPATRSFAGEG